MICSEPVTTIVKGDFVVLTSEVHPDAVGSAANMVEVLDSHPAVGLDEDGWWVLRFSGDGPVRSAVVPASSHILTLR